MRLLYVWDADYPWDVRTEKICLALTGGGHDIVIAARNLSGAPLQERRPEGLVERLPPGRAMGRHWRSFPAPFNPYWLAHLRRLIRRHEIELVMVRDIPLSGSALMAAGTSRPVILDMAENYPAMIQDIWTDRRQGRFDFLLRNPKLVAGVERSVVRRMAHIITVVEESSERLVRLGVHPDHLSVVSNTPPLARIGAGPVREAGSPLRLIYLGLMERHRGIPTVLDAAARLTREGTPFHLDLVGDGRDLELFQQQARSLGLRPDQVTFHGRVPHTQAIALIAEAHVGLVPHEARESWNTTIPNKLFDYMAAGLAVVTSDAIPAARVVRDQGAGLVFSTGSGEELANRVRQYLDLELWNRHRRAGQEAVRIRYNWESDTEVLLGVVARFGGSPARVSSKGMQPA